MTSEFIFHAFTTYVGIGERALAKVERHETSRENVTKKWDPDSQLILTQRVSNNEKSQQYVVDKNHYVCSSKFPTTEQMGCNLGKTLTICHA